MKTTLALTTLAAALCALPIGATEEAKTDEVAPDFQMKRCVNMGNALEAPKGNPWGRLYEKADYKRIKEAGFDTVRIPMRWSDYTGPAPDYQIDPAFAETADANIKWALVHGLKVIINIHHFNELMDDPGANTARFIALWEQIAARYADKPGSVWFEVLNEPYKNLKGAPMRALQRQAIEIIRQENPTRIVMLGGEEWSGIRTLGTNLSSDDPNVIYTFHYYDPFSFTHQQATWLGDDMPKGKRGWGSKADRAELAQAVTIASDFRAATGKPIFLGEFGANAPIDNKQRVKWAGAVKTAMEAADIPWCLWSYDNTFALYSRETGWDKDMLKALTSD